MMPPIRLLKTICAGLAVLTVAACNEEEGPVDPPIRALKTFVVNETERETTRRFPAVLEPAELNLLSFEIGGKLTEVTLDVGQFVSGGDVLAELDKTSLEFAVQNAEAGVSAAESQARITSEAFTRQEELFKRGAVSKVSVDDAQTNAEEAAASLDQANATLDNALEDISKSVMRAPIDGIINTVDVESFATVAAGTAIASIYSADSFEVSFSVNFDTVSKLVVGSQAQVRLADNPGIVLPAVVSELGSRADTVSSFPIVLTLEETNPILKAGMAVEASLSFNLPVEEGYLLPLTAMIMEGRLQDKTQPGAPGHAEVFVFDEVANTVKRQEITIAGVRDNAVLVIEGLELGDRVASAGVSFLFEGQTVKLLETE